MTIAAATLTLPRIEPFLGREMAGQSDVERIFAGLPTSSLLPSALREVEHPSTILRKRSEPMQRLGELYDDMLAKDADLAAFARKRRDAVLALPRRIVAEDGTPLARDTAQFVIQAFKRIQALDQSLGHQLETVQRGISFAEIIWERLERGPLAGAIVPVDIIDRPMWRFLFRPVEGKAPELFIRQPIGKPPIPAPPGKFIVSREGTKDNPWGGPGLLDDVYWYWFIKKTGWKWWAVFIEKWASPTVLGKYKHQTQGFASPGAEGEAVARTNEDQQAKLLAAARAIQQDQAVVIPDDLAIELLEATRSGSISYETFVQMCTRAEANLELGEVDTSGAGQGPGSFAKATVSNEVRLDKVKLDAASVAARMRDSILRWMVELNFGVDAPIPRFVIDTLDVENREERRRGIELLGRLGLPVSRRHIYSTALADEPGDGEETIIPRGASAAPIAGDGAAATPPAPPTEEASVAA
jgi:phage gp29-like protein